MGETADRETASGAFEGGAFQGGALVTRETKASFDQALFVN